MNMVWNICFAIFLCAFNAKGYADGEEIHGSTVGTVELQDFKSYVHDETHVRKNEEK